MGEFDTKAAARGRKSRAGMLETGTPGKLKPEILLRAVEKVCGMPREDFCGPAKSARAVFAKEALILSGRHLGATVTALSKIVGVSLASISRRHDLARQRSSADPELANTYKRIVNQYKRATKRIVIT